MTEWARRDSCAPNRETPGSMNLWQQYYTPSSIDKTLELLDQQAGRARIVAGATDLILEIERGIRPGVEALIDITRIPGLDHITMGADGLVHMGPLVTHNHCAGSHLIQDRAFALAKACWEVGAPQIRNRATIAGNLVTASPANDSIPPLMALQGRVTLRSTGGERTLPLTDFYTGFRETAMRSDELIVDIAFEPLPDGGRSTFFKLGLRKAQAISVVDVAAAITWEKDKVRTASITLGAVAPVIIHAAQAEQYLVGKRLDEASIGRAAQLAVEAASPIDDVRGSSRYRREMIRVATERSLRDLADGTERQGFPRDPVMLWGATEFHWQARLDSDFLHDGSQTIDTVINGRSLLVSGGFEKTLLRFLREDAGLIGTKEGCAEGECGACTVFLDGVAVMACMVPAARAHRADILTIEGLGTDGQLHPVQQSFIEEGAVQCGYCIPGFIMSGAKLLEERPEPSVTEVRESITGNLCRCTGYYPIVEAIRKAGQANTVSSDGGGR